MRRITSKDNRLIKLSRHLHKQNYSKKHELILIEGFRQAEEALLAGLPIEHVFLSDKAAQSKNWQKLQQLTSKWTELIMAGKISLLSAELFAHISATQNPQGIALLAGLPNMERIAQIAKGSGPYLVLENIQDPGNLGTIIRTAEAFAFEAVLITTGTVWPYNAKTLRAAMGSVFRLPIYEFDEVKTIAVEFLKHNIALWAADTGGISWAAAHKRAPQTKKDSLALLLGNEGSGLSSSAKASADLLITIPMPGPVESLNVATAAAILCYETSLMD